jgi:hypothetical protein
MPIRFQADADLNQVIVSGVVRRVPAIDFSTATSAGLAGLKDQEVLAVAARDGRVGHARSDDDASTFPRVPALTAQLQPYRRPATSSGWSDDLILIWTATQAEEWTDRIAFLPV